MDADELRRRTKLAVSRWSGVAVSRITLGDKLSELRGGSREPLRQRVNEEFSGESGMLIPPKVWIAKAAKTVADVRDVVKERTGS